MNHKNNLVFVPCTKGKIWDYFPSIGPQKASNVYTGPEFIFSVRLASEYADRIIIFSAKYGFLETDDYIDQTYDVTFDRKEDPCISVDDLKVQAVHKDLFHYEKITTFCGQLYNKNLYAVFQQHQEKGMIINNVE
tara:strand:+ start:1749 stop:2153 length:405 start_codon:yes stop_codon:yes gene_type:complete